MDGWISEGRRRTKKKSTRSLCGIIAKSENSQASCPCANTPYSIRGATFCWCVFDTIQYQSFVTKRAYESRRTRPFRCLAF